MPNALGQPTLLDIAKLNGCDPTVGLVEEVVRVSPELDQGYARTIKGLNYRARIRTSLPTVGFRAANAGSTVSSSTYENRLYEAYLLNPVWTCDKAVADAFEDGPQVFIAMEGVGILEASMLALSKQFYYGTASDTLGFPGLVDAVDSGMVLSATGSTKGNGSTTISTSVYAVRWGIRDVGWLWGNGGQLNLSPVKEIVLNDPSDSTKILSYYHQELLARPGLQVASKWSCARLCNLTSDSGKGLTDSLLGTLKSMFPAQSAPHAYLMTQKALEQLRKSRTATNPTGAPAPTPTDYEGVPILVTNGISDAEDIVS